MPLKRKTTGGPVDTRVLPAVVGDLSVEGSLTVKGQTRLERVVEQGGGDVYLHAWLNGTISAPNVTETRVVFNTVDVQRPEAPNIGAALYLDASGAFRAPIDGLYFVSATVTMLNRGTAQDNVVILRNQGPVPDIRGATVNPLGTTGSTYQQLTICSVIPLLLGQFAWVNLYQGSGSSKTIYGGYAETFIVVARIGNFNP